MNGYGDEKRGPVSRVLRWTLSPVFYWLDLYGPDGKPSNTKTLWTVAVLFMLIFVGRFGLQEAAKPDGLSLNFVLLAFGVLAAAGGVKSFKDFIRARTGGVADAAAVESVARASIAQRRVLGREDGIEPA